MNENGKKIIQNILISGLFLFIFVFALYGSRGLVFGIKIKEINIENGATYTESVFEIKGKAKNANKIYLNDREITRDKKGYFVENVALIEGYNTIEIRAEDKFGNKDKKEYSLFYKKDKVEISEDEIIESEAEISEEKTEIQKEEIINEENNYQLIKPDAQIQSENGENIYEEEN